MAQSSNIEESWTAGFHDACSRLDISSIQSIESFVGVIDAVSQDLAHSQDLREEAGNTPSVWSDLRKLWRDLSRAQLTFWDGDESEEEDGKNEGEDKKQQSLRALCASLAKFTRNIVAGVPGNQTRAFTNEPEIRRLLHYHTSWSAVEDRQSFTVTRILTQTLSNLVTSNQELIAQLWETYLNLREEQVVLIRTLTSPDARTVLASLVLILNCIHGNSTRAKMLIATPVGIRICISLLDDMVKLYDADESSDGARAFDIGYAIFTRFVEENLISDLYTELSIPDEIVTPHQTTLLKLMDSYLQSAQMSESQVSPKTLSIHQQLSTLLLTRFLALAAYAQQAIRRSLGSAADAVVSTATSLRGDQSPSKNAPDNSQRLSSAPAPPSELDVLLPKVCEALVLVTQCIVTITLEADGQEPLKNHATSDGYTSKNLKVFFSDTQLSNDRLPESLIELLRLLDLFLPRIQFGKPVVSPTSPGQTPTPTPAQGPATTHDPTGFSYLKRDLVRLLGILGHGTRSVQDRARLCGGIHVVMNLCVVDERNPYIREHAIFTLHNLLRGNSENQAVVDGIKPTGEWDEDGVLRDTPGAVRK